MFQLSGLEHTMIKLASKFMLLACSIGAALPTRAEITSSHTENQVVDSGYVSFRQKSLFSESEIKVPVPVGPWVVRISDDQDSTGTVRDGHRLVLDMIVNKTLVAQLWLMIYESSSMKWNSGTACEGKFLMQDKSSGPNNHCRAGKILTTYLTNRNSPVQKTLREAYVRDGISYSTSVGTISGFAEKHNSTALFWYLNIHPTLGKTYPSLLYKTEDFGAFLEKTLGSQGQSSELIKVLNGITDGLNKSIIGEDYPASSPTITGPIAFEQLRQGLNELDKAYLATGPTTNPPLSSVMNIDKGGKSSDVTRSSIEEVEKSKSTAQSALPAARPSSAEQEELERVKAQLAALQNEVANNQKETKPPLPDRSRVALVIGNSKYEVGALANPANDARDMAAALERQGFKVIKHDNLTLRQTQNAMREFADEFKKSDVGLVYYSGHGVEAKGVNYLIPVNANIRREYELTGGAYPASQITGMMEEIQASGDRKRVAILILDACRDNPLTRSWRSSGGGLARMDAPAGTFISFATSPGSVASDGVGRNSPFTKHLLQAMKKPNVPIELMFKEVRVGVVNETRGEQVPWESSSLMGDFYFNRTK
jgi:hypothetical protein